MSGGQASQCDERPVRPYVRNIRPAGDRDARCGGLGAGRVLRLKSGYNPNSSSVGSDIPTFLAFATAAGALTTVLLNVFGTVADLIRRRMSGEQTGAENSEE